MTQDERERSTLPELWLDLTPRETEMILRPGAGTGENYDLLRAIQAKTDRVTNVVHLTGAEVIRVQVAARNWRLGCEGQMKVLLGAIQRYV